MTRPRPPARLGRSGSALWRRIWSDLAVDWELDERERELLSSACEIADNLAALRKVLERDGVAIAGSMNQTIVHPALVESRQLRLAQARLLSSLELDDSAAEARSRAGKAAAEARWGKAERPRRGGGR